MKKLTNRILALCIMVSIIQSPITATSDSLSTATIAAIPMESSEMTTILNRLNEIKAMDKSTLTIKERKALRKEVRAIRDQVKKADAQGVYLSTGAIIIIILLLILIL